MLYLLTRGLSKWEKEWRLKHPKAGDFEVYQNNGVVLRLLGSASDDWWVKHKVVESFPHFGPYRTRAEAEAMVEAVVAALIEQQKPKVKVCRWCWREVEGSGRFCPHCGKEL